MQLEEWGVSQARGIRDPGGRMTERSGLLGECRVVVADGCDLELSGIVAALSNGSGGSGMVTLRFKVAGMYSDFNDFLHGLQQDKPTVAIFDDRLDSDCTPLKMLREVRRTVKDMEKVIRFVMLGSSYNGKLVSSLLAEGLDAYLYRKDPVSTLLTQAIKKVLENKPFVSPTALQDYAQMLKGVTPTSPIVAEELSPDEIEVIRCMIQDMDVSQIMKRTGMTQEKIYRVRREHKERLGKQTNEGWIAELYRLGIAQAIEEHYPDIT